MWAIFQHGFASKAPFTFDASFTMARLHSGFVVFGLGCGL
jgi:hypothetical protein